MTRMFPNELPILKPGVKPVQMITPCETEVIEETIDKPASTKYVLSADAKFIATKTYYILQAGTVDTYVATAVTADDPIPQPNQKYYEKIDIPAVSTDTQTVYDRYTDGMWHDILKTPEGGEKYVYREHPVEIFRTVTYKEGTTQHILREHARGLWANRHDLEYVSICHRLNETKDGESARIFT